MIVQMLEGHGQTVWFIPVDEDKKHFGVQQVKELNRWLQKDDVSNYLIEKSECWLAV